MKVIARKIKCEIMEALVGARGRKAKSKGESQKGELPESQRRESPEAGEGYTSPGETSKGSGREPDSRSGREPKILIAPYEEGRARSEDIKEV